MQKRPNGFRAAVQALQDRGVSATHSSVQEARVELAGAQVRQKVSVGDDFTLVGLELVSFKQLQLPEGLNPEPKKDLEAKLDNLKEALLSGYSRPAADPVVEATEKLIQQAINPFVRIIPRNITPAMIATAKKAVNDYKSKILTLTTNQKWIVAAFAFAGAVLGAILGFAAGLVAGAAIGGGLGSVAPVIGNITGAIAGGSIGGVATAIKGAGLGAAIGTAAGTAVLATGGGALAGILTRLGLFKQTPIKREVLDLANSVGQLIDANDVVRKEAEVAQAALKRSKV